ncbi:hypothetical protein SH528x_003665 [Novipirellula sp. SH528]|uniref:hypothetical protein n=1 Tax=Novipirellula sp. SH528 TaxID=3454466 RepID=UPI003F9F3B09
MPIEEGVQQTIHPLVFLFTGAGWPLLAFGLVFSILGLWNLYCGKHPTMVFVHSLLSLLPAMIAIVGIYISYNDFAELGSSSTAPKPSEFARIVGNAMSIGFCGLVSTVPPVALGIIGLWRLRPKALQPTTGN